MSCIRTCKRRIFYAFAAVISLVLLLHPARHGCRDFDYIRQDIITYNLHEELAKNFTSTALGICDYIDPIYDDVTLSPSLTEADLIANHRIMEGGEYAPAECKPKYSTAIIVPYRDQAEHLRGFLMYMHTFLRRQSIHYRIYVVEQVETKPFNRAKLLNIGAKVAMQAGYPCLVLHDVDLLPLKPANIYACTEQPRHMAACINSFRFVLPSLDGLNGAVALMSKQFKEINGLSNEYYGLGDSEDLYSRLQAHNMNVCRFEPKTSLYYQQPSYMTVEGEQPKKLNKFSLDTMKNDGLNTLRFTEVATIMHPLFTHLVIDL